MPKKYYLLTWAEELEILKKQTEKVRKNPAFGFKMLQRTGIYDKNGQLTEYYRDEPEESESQQEPVQPQQEIAHRHPSCKNSSCSGTSIPMKGGNNKMVKKNAPLTREQELELLKAHSEKIKNDPEYGIKLLQRAGILDENLQLTEPYRNE